MSNSDFKNQYKKRLKNRIEEASTVRKIVSIILTVLVLALLIGGVSGYFYVKSALEPVEPENDKQINVEIPLGSSTSSIASILEENEIIKNDLIFRFYTKFKNESGFQAGNYQFTSSMTLNEIIETLKTGKLVKESVYKVTVPEGRNLEQIAEVYAEDLPFTKEEFMEKVDDEAYIKEKMSEYPQLLTEDILNEEIRHPLEGYLFAATYDVYVEDPTIDQIVKKMLDQTQAVVLPYVNQMGDLEGIENVHDLVTMASLLENEARTAESRKMISGVFQNRLDKDMKLQTDPTVLYAHGEHKDRVLYEDLEIESPYNTYYITGLPVGPISNFNENSLQAAAKPKDHDYFYFLADSSGEIHYASSLEEHNQLKNEYIN
ncbi:endolytic transglycosylase MltG [Halobacillus litoralis]|uniref:endolytic transglycosylase MltG n=1 Tax=Halobacillus litoralis TaxID=45668 RepID=UPI001CFCF3DD|nr:endolytic transglycosylase MltG [Halobacillus litoralis]WLR46185.1 endolytic transglycosylase MltG [Halobacillus litoralis]